MCMRVNCGRCKRPTWTGCGAHIEQALAGVPAADRCHCSAAQKKEAQPRRKWLGLF